MKYERGMTTGWLVVIVVAAIALLGALGYAIHAWGDFTQGLIDQGDKAGYSRASSEFTARDNTEMVAMVAERNKAQAELNAARALNVELQATSNQIYRKGIRDGKAQLQTDVADYKSGALRLRCPGEKTAAVADIHGATGNADKPASGGPGIAGAGNRGLPSEDPGVLLLWVGSEANRLRDKVNALIAIVIGDRKQINGWNEDGHPVLRMTELNN